MKVLLLGSGGREHALAWKLAASPLLSALYAAPGNPGIAEHAELVELNPADGRAVTAFCRRANIDLVAVGPEAPLVAGLADHLSSEGVKVFGPKAAAARLEGSKEFARRLCAEHRIPGARFAVFDRRDTALAHVCEHGAPIVLKADGLHAGKGVVVALTVEEARDAVDRVFAMQPDGPVLVEECLEGEEASFFSLVAGEQVAPLASAQDHKRAFDGDQGPNTGGMGAYSPAPVMTPEMESRALEEIVRPTARALARSGAPYSGVLYAGLMITASGPKLIEYNVRFGDPECQVLMPRLKDDLLTLMLATCDGALDKLSVRWRAEAAITVVLAAKGYPGDYEKGSTIGGLARAAEVEGVTIFHAGTKRDGDRLVANGGRVLNVTAVGATVAEAQARAYRAAERIDWPQGFFRRDIGWRALAR